MKHRVYAIYKGDEFIMVGTAKECAARLKVQEDTIRWMTYPISKKRNKGNRMDAFVIEDDEKEREQEERSNDNGRTN